MVWMYIMYVLVNGKYRNYWKYTVRISKGGEGGGEKWVLHLSNLSLSLVIFSFNIIKTEIETTNSFSA